MFCFLFYLLPPPLLGKNMVDSCTSLMIYLLNERNSFMSYNGFFNKGYAIILQVLHFLKTKSCPVELIQFSTQLKSHYGG